MGLDGDSPLSYSSVAEVANFCGRAADSLATRTRILLRAAACDLRRFACSGERPRSFMARIPDVLAPTVEADFELNLQSRGGILLVVCERSKSPHHERTRFPIGRDRVARGDALQPADSGDGTRAAGRRATSRCAGTQGMCVAGSSA